MFKTAKGFNNNLIIIAIICIVNALGYGIIIPILYTYSLQYGLTDFQNGLLFALFSLCQFIATPVIGRFSDKYGRKPMLLFSLIGTLISFIMMAFAPNAAILFLARALDGLSAGNIPVASAVIADTTKPKNRAKGFGIIGASFGFGFLVGPAISALTVGFGMHWPFLIAAGITVGAIVMVWFMLPETNKHIGQIIEGKLFDYGKMIRLSYDKYVGKTLIITLLYSLAFALFIYAFQPFSVKVLELSATEISVIYTIFGVVGIAAQAVVIPSLIKWQDEKRSLSLGLALMAFAFLFMYISRSLAVFIAVSVALALGNAIVSPMVQALLSKEVSPKEQGTIQGINASYMSVGFILGPILGGALATQVIQLPFLAGSIITGVCLVLAIYLAKLPPYVREHENG